MLIKNLERIYATTPIPFLNEFFMVPKKKRIAFYWEPHTSIENDAYWNKIYTFNDDVIDNVTVFKFYYPVMHEMVCPIPNFENKKLCVMVSRAATRERNQIIRFFETKPKNDFELFGYQPVIPSSRYCGSIPGHEFGSEKAQLMKQYRFAVCFENSFINGYITEKLFSCFEAGCVPIYLGAPNVTQYIPKGCFIDYRDFKTDEELYQFIKNMTKPDYDLYIENIRKFLVSPEAKLFSSENFNKTVYEAVTK